MHMAQIYQCFFLKKEISHSILGIQFRSLEIILKLASLALSIQFISSLRAFYAPCIAMGTVWTQIINKHKLSS